MPKQEFPNLDAQPVVLYGKQTDSNNTAFPVTIGPHGEVLVNYGNLIIPIHDTQIIDTTNPTTSTITYKLQGVEVGVKTISVAGSVTTITIT